MKYAIHILILLLVLGMPRSAPSQQEEEFASPSGHFAIKLPRHFDDYQYFVPLKVGTSQYSLSLYKWNTPRGLFTVSYSITAKNLEQLDQAKDFFGEFRKMLRSRLSEKGQVLSDKSISFESHPGIELITESPGLVTAYRVLLVRNRFYMLTLALKPEQRDAIPGGEQILGSFRLLTAAELAGITEQLVQSFPAAPLPQQPVVSKDKTDAADENLKGRVKSVLTEREIYDERSPVEKKLFNEDGYRVTEIAYSGDIPISFTSYGYLNGARVLRKRIKGDSVASKVAGGKADPLSQTIEFTREIKWQYNDRGSLSEITTYEADGQVAERRTFKTSANKREIDTLRYDMLFSERVHNHSKTIEILDDQGNPTEVTEIAYQELPANYYSTSNPRPVTERTTSSTIERKVTEEKYTHTYQYDSQGNWIKRDTFRPTKDKPGVARVPIVTTYRQITYW